MNDGRVYGRKSVADRDGPTARATGSWGGADGSGERGRAAVTGAGDGNTVGVDERLSWARLADAAEEPNDACDELELLELEPLPLLKLPPLREVDDEDEEEREILPERLALDELRLMLDLPEE